MSFNPKFILDAVHSGSLPKLRGNYAVWAADLTEFLEKQNVAHILTGPTEDPVGPTSWAEKKKALRLREESHYVRLAILAGVEFPYLHGCEDIENVADLWQQVQQDSVLLGSLTSDSVPKINGSNCAQWTTDVSKILRQKNVINILADQYQKPTEPTSDSDRFEVARYFWWSQQNRIARIIILMGLKDYLHHGYLHIESAAELWKTVRRDSFVIDSLNLESITKYEDYNFRKWKDSIVDIFEQKMMGESINDDFLKPTEFTSEFSGINYGTYLMLKQQDRIARITLLSTMQGERLNNYRKIPTAAKMMKTVEKDHWEQMEKEYWWICFEFRNTPIQSYETVAKYVEYKLQLCEQYNKLDIDNVPPLTPFQMAIKLLHLVPQTEKFKEACKDLDFTAQSITPEMVKERLFKAFGRHNRVTRTFA